MSDATPTAPAPAPPAPTKTTTTAAVKPTRWWHGWSVKKKFAYGGLAIGVLVIVMLTKKKTPSDERTETCTDPVPKGTRSCIKAGIGVDAGTTCLWGPALEHNQPNVLCCPHAPKCTADDLGPGGSAALGAVWGAPLEKLCMATASYDPGQCQTYFPDHGSALCRPSPAACASLSAADCRDLQTAPFTPPCTVPMPDECRPACTTDQCHAVCRPSAACSPTLFTC